MTITLPMLHMIHVAVTTHTIVSVELAVKMGLIGVVSMSANEPGMQ